MKIAALTDLIQETEGILEVPEIRVWCHPHKIGESGSDYYQVFDSFKEAHQFIAEHKEAEQQPLIAFRGYELNIYVINPKKQGSR
jgi:hypothetical protein